MISKSRFSDTLETEDKMCLSKTNIIGKNDGGQLPQQAEPQDKGIKPEAPVSMSAELHRKNVQ